MNEGASEIYTAANVHGWTGEDIRLPCDIQAEPLAVVWVKESVSNQQPRTTKAAFIDGKAESMDERFDIEKDFSLVITDLRVVDAGIYHCDVTPKNAESFSNITQLTISFSVIGTTPNVRGWKEEAIRLQCIIPVEPLALYWTKESDSDKQPPTIKATFIDGNFESREERFNIDKNFSLLITNLEVADEGLYHCAVVLTNLDDFSNSTFLTVDCDTLGLIIGLAIGVPVALSILFLLSGIFLQKYHPDYLPRKGLGWKPRPRRRKRQRVDEEGLIMG
ncbi:uncharacterized protein [Diadema antillarum]|uniref:uncharacterized protein n=1 Tax=Diadema antillarum TaxID=105358 RepID=UPI003A848870